MVKDMVKILIGITLLLACADVHADVENEAMPLLSITNSPRANGMGGCVATMISEEAPLYNPAALGFFHSSKTFGGHVPIETSWLPELTSEVKLTSWGMSVGLSESRSAGQRKSATYLSYGLAFSSMKMSYPSFARTDATGHIIGVYGGWDRADCISAAVAVNGRIRIGLGATFKFLKSHQTNSGAGVPYFGSTTTTTADIGLLVAVPLNRLMAAAFTDPNDEPSDLTIPLNLTAGFVMTNIYGDIVYIDAAQSDELPRLMRIGLSLNSPITRNNAPVMSFQVAGELESGGDNDVYKLGVEVGALGTLFVRAGRQDMGEGQPVINTLGSGVSVNGVIQWLISAGKIRPSDDFAGRAIRSLDISFDYAKYSGSSSGPLNGTKFLNVRMSF